MITVFPIIVVMSAAPGAGWGDQATGLAPDPLGYKLLSPGPIIPAPLRIISDQML